MTIPPLNALWRPKPSGPNHEREDRELIRGYANWPLATYNLTQLTAIMNRVALTSTPAVVQVQGWIDEVEHLEQSWAGQVADGTAHLGNVTRYSGPAPGTTLTRDDLKKKVDVLEWDTSLQRVEYESSGAASTAGGVLGSRIADLKARILQTLGIEAAIPGGSDSAMLRRS